MNYLICDDEPAAAESLKAKIAELEPDSSVRIFTTLQALLFNIEDIADRIDGVFMDIKLRNANGISGAAAGFPPGDKAGVHHRLRQRVYPGTVLR